MNCDAALDKCVYQGVRISVCSTHIHVYLVHPCGSHIINCTVVIRHHRHSLDLLTDEIGIYHHDSYYIKPGVVLLLEACHHFICYMSGGHDQELLALAMLCIFREMLLPQAPHCKCSIYVYGPHEQYSSSGIYRCILEDKHIQKEQCNYHETVLEAGYEFLEVSSSDDALICIQKYHGYYIRQLRDDSQREIVSVCIRIYHAVSDLECRKK